MIHAPPTQSLVSRVGRTVQSLAQLPLSPFQDFVEPLDNFNQFVGIGLFARLFTKLTPLRIGHSFLHKREEAIRSLRYILFSIEQWPLLARLAPQETGLRHDTGDALAIPVRSG